MRYTYAFADLNIYSSYDIPMTEPVKRSRSKKTEDKNVTEKKVVKTRTIDTPVKAAADESETTNPVTRKPRVKPFDPIAAAMNKYTDMGWTCMRQKTSINDLVAHKSTRMHFIQVVTLANIDDAKYTGLAKNTFIQNAFANNATPIFAHVITSMVKDAPRIKVTFEDVNTNCRIIIGSAKKTIE